MRSLRTRPEWPQLVFVLLLAAGTGCGRDGAMPAPTPPTGSGQTPTTPTPTTPETPQPVTPLVVTGAVLDADTLQPIAGATVSVNGRHLATTDAGGNYSVTAPRNDARYTFVSAEDYDPDFQMIRASNERRLHRSRRISAGATAVVSVNPGDSLCVNNYWDDPESVDSVCRIVRVTAPSDGVVTIQARSIDKATQPLLEVELTYVPGRPWFSQERLGNVLSVNVVGGDEVLAMITLPRGVGAQSFDLETIFTPK